MRRGCCFGCGGIFAAGGDEHHRCRHGEGTLHRSTGRGDSPDGPDNPSSAAGQSQRDPVLCGPASRPGCFFRRAGGKRRLTQRRVRQRPCHRRRLFAVAQVVVRQQVGFSIRVVQPGSCGGRATLAAASGRHVHDTTGGRTWLAEPSARARNQMFAQCDTNHAAVNSVQPLGAPTRGNATRVGAACVRLRTQRAGCASPAAAS